MINYSKTKVGFTNGADFVLSANSYVGYYHVIDGSAYQGANILDVSLPLEAKNNISADALLSKFLYDRIIDDDVSLPYSLNDILVAPNETCNARVFNDRLEKLYSNAIYLYNNLFLASNNIPNGYNRAAGVSKATNALSWSQESTQSGASFAPFASAGYAVVDDAIQFTAVKTYNNDYVFFGITPTHFVALSSNKDLLTFDVETTNEYVAENNDLKFTQLASFSVAGKYAFLCDAAQNTIYKYDVSGYFSGDATIYNRRILIDSIGGFGSALSKTKFDSPNIVFAVEPLNRLYVNDSNNRCIKIFDTSFSYVATKTFAAGSNTIVKCFGYNPILQRIYFVTKNAITQEHTIQICDADLNAEETYSLPDALEQNEEYNGFVFSKNDSNIFYLHTNQNVFKKFVNKPNKTIGKWLLYKSGTTATHIWNLENSLYNLAQWNWNEGGTSARTALSINGMSSFFISDIDEREEIFLFVGANDKSFNRILHYAETNIFNTALGATVINAYNISQAKVDDNEFVNAMVVNKELYKIAYNVLNIIRFITSRYAAEYDFLNNLVFKNTIALTDEEFALINFVNLKNLYVHENEIMNSIGPINRCFRELCNLQNNALQIVRTRINNFVSSLSGAQTIILN